MLSFKLFRVVYSRLLGREYLSATFSQNPLPLTNIFSGVHFLTYTLMSFVVSGLFIRDGAASQVYYLAIELIIIELIAVIFEVIDVKK